MDFPGHYMRRIKSVAMTIPAVVGPYSSIRVTLNLLSHKFRVSRSAANGKDYLTSQGADCEAFRFDRLPSTSIAISSGNADPSVFDPSFSGPPYMGYPRVILCCTTQQTSLLGYKNPQTSLLHRSEDKDWAHKAEEGRCAPFCPHECNYTQLHPDA